MADPLAPCDHPEVAGRAPLRSLVLLGLLAAATLIVALLSLGSGEGPFMGSDETVEGSKSSSTPTQGPASLDSRPSRETDEHDRAAADSGSHVGRASRPEGGVGTKQGLVLWVRETPGGVSVAGARCRFEPTRDDAGAATTAESAGVSAPFEVVTNAEGRADVPESPTAGTWIIEAEGFVPRSSAFEVGSGDATIWLQRGRRVEGVVLNAAGLPVPGAHVLWSSSRLVDAASRTQTSTGPDGRFRIDPPANAKIHVTAWARHGAPALATIEPGTESHQLKLRLSRALNLMLTVRSADATPLIDVRWSVDRPLTVEGAEPWTDAGVPLPIQIRGLGETPFDLIVSAPGFREGRRRLSPPVGSDDPVQSLEVVLDPDAQLGRMRLRLVGQTGSLRTWAGDEHLHIERLDGRAHGVFGSKRDGDALEVVGLAPGPHAATTWLPDCAPARVEFEIEAGKTTEVRAVTSDEARLRVRVKGVAGRRVLVRLLSGKYAAYPTVLEDPRGQAYPQAATISGIPSWVFLVGEEGVLFGGLPAGRLRIEAVSPDVTATPVEVELRAGDVTDADVAASAR